jgi:hypothetical protein
VEYFFCKGDFLINNDVFFNLPVKYAQYYDAIDPLQKSRPGKKCMCVHCTLDHKCIYPGLLSQGQKGRLSHDLVKDEVEKSDK